METNEITTEKILFLTLSNLKLLKNSFHFQDNFFLFLFICACACATWSRNIWWVMRWIWDWAKYQNRHRSKSIRCLRPWSNRLLVKPNLIKHMEDFDATLEHKNRTSKAAFINKGQWSRQGCNSKDFTQIWQKGSLILNKNGPSSKSGHSQTAQEILKRIAHTVDNFQDYHFMSGIQTKVHFWSQLF